MPCLGPPSGDPDLRYPFPTHEFRCDLREEDPQRIYEAFTIRALVFGPSTTAVDLTIIESEGCTCPAPRFDAVTLAGVRHSEFCCACGRPGPNDHTC